MSRRNYSKSADRSHHHESRTRGDADNVRAAIGHHVAALKPGGWYCIYKDEVKLALNKNKAAALAHAVRIGGIVKKWDSVAKVMAEVAK